MSSPVAAPVTCTVEDDVAHVRLARPEKLNALTLPMLDELAVTARRLRRDRRLRAVVLSGEGEAFCAGLDLGSVMRDPVGVARAFVPRPWRGTNTFQEACWAGCRSRSSPRCTATAWAGACRSPWPPTSGSPRRTRRGRCWRAGGGSCPT